MSILHGITVEICVFLLFSLCTCHDEVIQVNKKFCELKRGNIGIVEKAQGTRFGMSPKYSRYSGIASWNHVLCPM